MSNKRRMMSLELAGFSKRTMPSLASRPLVENDYHPLARLMFDAYHGTIDDAGEPFDAAVEEVQRTFAGEYGRMLWDASFAINADQAAGVIAAATVVTFWQQAPLLAFSITMPRAQRQGLAASLIGRSALALLSQGHTQLVLFVTRGNVAAERLYEKLGFQDVPSS